MNPLSLSIGSVPDILKMTVLNQNLFVSKTTEKTIENLSEFSLEIPRQFVSVDQKEVIEKATNSLETAAETTGALQLFLTIGVGLPLKALWIFMNQF